MEEWRAIPGHRGYEVSSEGRVRSIDRWIKYSDGRRARFKGVMLKPGKGKHYLQVALGGNAPNKYVHVLVARAFLGKMPKHCDEVAHNNDIKTDNRASNLRYDTRSGNQLDRNLHGTGIRGEANPRAKFTKEIIAEIRSRKVPISVLIEKYGISRSHLHAVRNGAFWGWL